MGRMSCSRRCGRDRFFSKIAVVFELEKAATLQLSIFRNLDIVEMSPNLSDNKQITVANFIAIEFFLQ